MEIELVKTKRKKWFMYSAIAWLILNLFFVGHFVLGISQLDNSNLMIIVLIIQVTLLSIMLTQSKDTIRNLGYFSLENEILKLDASMIKVDEKISNLTSLEIKIVGYQGQNMEGVSLEQNSITQNHKTLQARDSGIENVLKIKKLNTSYKYNFFLKNKNQSDYLKGKVEILKHANNTKIKVIR